MSTKSSIFYRDPTADEPSVHIYEDALAWMRDEASGIYIEIQGAIALKVETLRNARTAVTIQLPRKTAMAIGLIPSGREAPEPVHE